MKGKKSKAKSKEKVQQSMGNQKNGVGEGSWDF